MYVLSFFFQGANRGVRKSVSSAGFPAVRSRPTALPHAAGPGAERLSPGTVGPDTR